MKTLTESLINKASLKGFDVKLTSNLSLKCKASKFKTWPGNFTYESRKDLLSSLRNIVINGCPAEPKAS